MGEFSHFDDQGNARMLDVSGKADTERTAVARGSIFLSKEAMEAVLGRKVKKGDVFTVAQVAGIMGAKKCSELIPLCHILPLQSAKISFQVSEEEGRITVESLTGVSVTLLTIYDMCKAIDKRMHMEGIHLVEKQGGKSGAFYYEEEKK